MTIHLGRTLLAGSCDLPGNGSSTPITGSEEIGRTSLIAVSLFGLAPQGVCLAEHVATLAGDAFTSPFHHRPPQRRSLTRPFPDRAVCSLLHSSVGSPRLAVSQPAVLWCSDFPLNPGTQRSPDLLHADGEEYSTPPGICCQQAAGKGAVGSELVIEGEPAYASGIVEAGSRVRELIAGTQIVCAWIDREVSTLRI